MLNNQCPNLVQYFEHRDMSSPSKLLTFSPVQNKTTANRLLFKARLVCPHQTVVSIQSNFNITL